MKLWLGMITIPYCYDKFKPSDKKNDCHTMCNDQPQLMCNYSVSMSHHVNGIYMKISQEF